MQGSKFGYVGIGRYLPQHILTNAHLERMVDTSDEWIVQRTGIRQRRIIGSDESVLTMAAAAAKAALEDSGVEPSKIKYIQVGVNTHFRFPSLASMVEEALGVKSASASDVSAGCSAFIFAVEHIFDRLRLDQLTLGEENYGLAVGVDALSLVTDWTDRSTCVLFGDGAGAVVIGPSQSGELLATVTRTQGEYADLLYLESQLAPPLIDPGTMTMASRNGMPHPMLRMEGRKVFVVAVRSMMADVRAVIAKYNRMSGENLSLDDVQFVIPHQANLRIVAAVQEGMGLREDQVYRDGVINYGNTSAASIPIGYVDVAGLRPGALVVDVAFGAGFASGAILRRNPN